MHTPPPSRPTTTPPGLTRVFSWFSPSPEKDPEPTELLSALMLIPGYLNHNRLLTPEFQSLFNRYFDIENMRHLLSTLKKKTPDPQEIELAHTVIFLMYQMLLYIHQSPHMSHMSVIKAILDDLSRKVFKIDALGTFVFKPGESLMTCITTRLYPCEPSKPSTVFFPEGAINATITINDKPFPLMLTPLDQPHRLLRPFEIAPC